MDPLREYCPLTDPNTPTGWERDNGADLPPTCAVKRSHQPVTHPCAQNVLTCQSGIIRVLEHVRRGVFFFFFSSCARLCVWVSAVLHYRVCLLFNRSAEEVTPQSMSQPSCIIAPLCHCQRLGRATSDCFSPPLFSSPPPSVFFPSLPLQSLFSLDSLTYPAEIDRARQTKEWAYWMLWRPTGKKSALKVFSPQNVVDEL